MTPTPTLPIERGYMRLMRAGRIEEAGSLAERNRRDMKNNGKTLFSSIKEKADARDMWEAVRKLTAKIMMQQP